MITVYAGAPLQLIGSLQQNGVPDDFSLYGALTANLYDQSGVTLITALTVAWIDVTTGQLQITASNTSAWPAGKLRIDCKLISPSGAPIFGPPTYIRVAQSPLG